MSIQGYSSSLINLSTRLRDKASNDGLDDTSIEWQLFIKDHREYILETSTIVFIDPGKMTQYEYHLRWYLEDHDISTEILWIIMYLNNIYLESEFFNIDRLYIPKLDTIRELRKKYMLFNKMLKNAEYTV